MSVVDLSPGGALLNLPFQIRPDARMTVEFRAASERMMLPFRLLRCYVRSLKGGVQYEAAGEFVHGLDWKPLLTDVAAQATSSRLVATLEAFLRPAATGRAVEFDQLLMWVLDAARRGEPADRLNVEIRLRLMRIIPSIGIKPVTTSTLPDPARGARFFGFDFRSERPLTTPDRRILRVAARLLSIVNATAASRAAQPLDFKARRAPDSGVVAYGAARWQRRRQAEARDPWEQSA